MDQTRRVRCENLYKPAKWCFTFIVMTGLALVLTHSLMQPKAWTQEVHHVEVRTTSGLVTGTARVSYTGRRFLSFEGLPYAQPPLGPLRFKDPQVPPPTWNGTFSAWVPREGCLAVDKVTPTAYIGDEDCLYLNVYTPELDGCAPVFVWFGDGDFEHRGGDPRHYRPDRLVDKSVVVVTVEYRLGVLGFLNTEDLASPGNYGLKDQRAALLWVRDNIAAFGGDPTAVTISGASAGAASVGYHLLSPLSTGLFRAAIAMGGSPLNTWAFNSSPRVAAMRIGEVLTGNSFQTSKQLVDYLRTLPASKLVIVQAEANAGQDWESSVRSAFVPSVDSTSEAAYLTDPPWRALERGLPNAVPFLTGTTSAEGKHLLQVTNLLRLQEQFVSLVAPLLRLPTQQQRRRTAALVRSFYFGDDAIASTTVADVLNLLTDMMFLEGVDRMARTVATLSSHPVYYYQYMYCTQNGTELPGAEHGEDARHILHFASGKQEPVPRSEEATVHDAWLSMLIEFTKTGNPSQAWPPYSVANPAYMGAGCDLRPQYDLLPVRMDFWRSILPPRLRI